MSEFCYGTRMGKHRQFSGFSLPDKFRVSGNLAIPNVWECANSRNMKTVCGKPYHYQSDGLRGN